MWDHKATNVKIATSTYTRSLSTGTLWRSSFSISIYIAITRVEEACVGREEKKKKIGRVWPGSKSGGSNLDLRVNLQVNNLLAGDLSS